MANDDGNLGDRVLVLPLMEFGKIHRIRHTDGDPLYTIFLENNKATPDGIFYARRQELSWV